MAKDNKNLSGKEKEKVTGGNGPYSVPAWDTPNHNSYWDNNNRNPLNEKYNDMREYEVSTSKAGHYYDYAGDPGPNSINSHYKDN